MSPRDGGGAVLVTGSSRGIGKQVCEQLIRTKRPIYATARSVETLSDLEALGCQVLYLDVTDESSAKSAVATIEQVHGYVDVLINNAGYGLYGPVEQIPIAEVKDEFETNFFGLVRLTQLVLPQMRARHRGRIVNVSSMAGKLCFPGGGFYHASKFALEAFSDALRIEVEPFGIRVVVVEPGPVSTEWSQLAAASVPLDDDESDAYSQFKTQVAMMLIRREGGVAKRFSSSPRTVARTIVRASTAGHPRTRYRVGVLSKVLVPLRPLLPDRVFDAMARRAFQIR